MSSDAAAATSRWVQQPALVLVGRSVQRVDALAKAVGKPLYTTDLIPPNALFVKVVRSSIPHGFLKQVDVSAARQAAGVAAILTAKDIPGENISCALFPDRPLLCSDRVRMVGDPIALVVARSLVHAEEAAEQVRMEYEPLPTVFSPLAALEPGAPQLHPNGNIAKHVKVRKGDVNLGFAASDIIVENTFSTAHQEPAPLETEAGIAIPEPDGSLTCVGSMQTPYQVQTGVAKLLGVAPERIRVIQAATGGAFGPKSDEMPVDVCGMAALAAIHTGQPAVIAYTREESITGHTKRHPFTITNRTGVTNDGRLLAWQARLVADTGAYASLGPLVVIRAAYHATGPYVVPHVQTDSYCVYTNHTMAGSFRGFGGPQALYAAECQMDEIAHGLGIDPLDLRLRNLLRPGTHTATGQLLDESCGLEECLLRATDAAEYRRKRHEYAQQTGRYRRGIGIAAMYHGNSLGPEGNDYATVTMKMTGDQRIHVYTALTEYGTGAPSALLQIAADELGIPMEWLQLERPDTKYAQDTGPTVASRTVVIGGRATQIAAQKIRERLSVLAASLLNCSPADLRFADGVIMNQATGAHVGFWEVATKYLAQVGELSEVGYYIAPPCEFDGATGQGTPYLQYTYGAVVAEVEIDTQLGTLTPLRLTTAYDVGKAINPLTVEGQIEGGAIQGLGYAIMEELVHRDGVPQNPQLADYFIPTAKDVPPIQNIIIEYPGPIGPHGAKAMGEPPIDLPAPAVANAVRHAIGTRIPDLPITAEKLLLTLLGKR